MSYFHSQRFISLQAFDTLPGSDVSLLVIGHAKAFSCAIKKDQEFLAI